MSLKRPIPPLIFFGNLFLRIYLSGRDMSDDNLELLLAGPRSLLAKIRNIANGIADEMLKSLRTCFIAPDIAKLSDALFKEFRKLIPKYLLSSDPSPPIFHVSYGVKYRNSFKYSLLIKVCVGKACSNLMLPNFATLSENLKELILAIFLSLKNSKIEELERLLNVFIDTVQETSLSRNEEITNLINEIKSRTPRYRSCITIARKLLKVFLTKNSILKLGKVVFEPLQISRIEKKPKKESLTPVLSSSP